MSNPRLVAEFATADDYLAAHDAEVTAGGLLVRGAILQAGAPAAGYTLVVRIAGKDVAELPASIASIAVGTGIAVIFLAEPVALLELAARLREPAPEGNTADLDRLTLPERIKLAQTAPREVRMKLLRDPNKQLHAFVLKNPRITLEEVQFAARQPALAPDALKLIAEHSEWSNNLVIATNLVRNPRTPLPLALKLLPRLSSSDLRSIAKGNARPPLVQAARKLVTG